MRVEVVEVFSLVNHSGRTDDATVIVDEDVAHDCEDPTLEVGVVHILAFVIEGLQGGVLEQIVSVVSV